VYERLKDSRPGDGTGNWERWMKLLTKARDMNFVGLPPRLLPNKKLPCGFPLNKKELGKRLRHYRGCSHPYCKWRVQAAITIQQALRKSRE